MNGVFVLIGIFLVIVYIYIYVKIKKSKEKTNNIDSIRDFNNSYKHLNGVKKSQPEISDDKYISNPYKNYVTKYNSSEDYREKR